MANCGTRNAESEGVMLMLVRKWRMLGRDVGVVVAADSIFHADSVQRRYCSD